MADHTPSPALRIPQLAHELNVHPETARRMVVDGRIAAYKVGNRWRVDRAAVDAYKAAHLRDETRAAS